MYLQCIHMYTFYEIYYNIMCLILINPPKKPKPIYLWVNITERLVMLGSKFVCS